MDVINFERCPFCGAHNIEDKITLTHGWLDPLTYKVKNLLHCNVCNYTFELAINADFQ